MKRTFIFSALALLVAACAPSDGPSVNRITSDARQADVPILRLTPSVISGLGTPRRTAGFQSFSNTSYTPGIIRPGDAITVTVFDTGEAGLFSVSDSGSINLGEFVVSPSGSVALPFAGTVNIGGRSTIAAQRAVTERLRENAINPYATVSIARNVTDTFTVQGNVSSGGLYPLSGRSERVLDGIALAGGSSGQPDNTMVTLVRGGTTGQQVLASVISDPSQNVPLQPGDVVIVGGGDATFISDGALTSTGEFPFVEGQLSLAQAVARSGGLSDGRSNPRAVFVFRRQPVGESFRLQDRQGNIRTVTGDVIFRVDFNSPQERLNANQFQMRDGDVLYVGNAPLANFAKFFQIFDRPPEVPATPSLPG